MTARSLLSSDSIAALATPPGRSALGIVRMTGDRVWEIAAQACGHVTVPDTWTPRQALIVRILAEDGGTLDEGVLLPWRGPESSTGEDLVEFIGHGSPAGLELVLERFLELGAAPAEPGEFTRRAFLNGKLSLDQAESIASFIDARTGTAARASLRVLLGGLKTKVQELQERLRDTLGLVELELDFNEEELRVFDRVQFAKDAASLRHDLDQLQRQAEASKYLRDGIFIVLAGETNAGKSTLFNRWAGQERAIVSEVPGTTRDYLDARLEWEGIPVRLVDTAGLRLSEEAIEQEGMRRSRTLLEQADILLWLLTPPDFVLPDESVLRDPRLILVRNKADLSSETPGALSELDPVSVSAKLGDGVEALRRRILERLLRGADVHENLGLEQRHARQLLAAKQAVERASEVSESSESEEVIAVELRAALDALSEIGGSTAGEDLLNRIFSRFCIGK